MMMYDTLHLWLPCEQAGTDNLLAHTEPYLKGITQHKRDDDRVYISGMFSGNYKVNVSLSGISLKGSLAKYYLPDNMFTLTRSDSARAIEQMADELHLPIEQAKVTRIDFAQNFLMKYKPETYYGYLGESQYYKRLSQPESLYYRNGQRTKLFYNKAIESKRRGFTLPDVWQGQNVLRYEIRYTSRLHKQFKLPEVTAGILPDEKFYIELVNRWINEYEAINKQHLINLNLTDMNSPKSFWKQVQADWIKRNGGEMAALEMVEDLKAKGAFEKPEYYSRLKKEIKTLCKEPDLTVKSELVAELDKKVKAAKRYGR